MMQLYWSSRSPFVRKVMVVVHELGLFERIELVRAAVHPMQPSTEVMLVNPLSKIPTLVIGDGTSLFDSRVICEYLASEAKSLGLFPASGPDRWRALACQALGDGLMDIDVYWMVERQRDAAAQSPAIIEGFRRKLAAAADRLEADDWFLGCKDPTIGHIAVASALSHFDFRFADAPWRTPRPRLSAWFAGFSERPSMRATAFVDQY